jgi:M6 family metalloprotease-like protein
MINAHRSEKERQPFSCSKDFPLSNLLAHTKFNNLCFPAEHECSVRLHWVHAPEHIRKPELLYHLNYIGFTTDMRKRIVLFIRRSISIGFFLLSFFPKEADAVSPKPGLFDQKGYCSQTAAWKPMLQVGIDEPEPVQFPVAGSRKAIVLLVEFTDNRANKGGHSPTAFQRLLFDSTGAVETGSMYEYYQEVSYGRLFLYGHVSVWLEAPQTNAYYADDQFGRGSWPRSSVRFAYDAVVTADPYVDFSEYDGDGDGEVDAVFIIHAGPGGEETGNPLDLWSHKSTIPANPNGTGRGYMTDDGVKVTTYTMQPEENDGGQLIGIGVFCHEYGHILGLPDLYDRDNSSEGIGNWGLMGTGSWGGDGQSPQTPVHLCAWSKEHLGWVEPIILDHNRSGVFINRVEDHPEVFKLWTEGTPGDEYFLVVNRQTIGFDSNLPNSGLLIWHIDNSVTTQNDNESHKLVDLEAADGNDDMDVGANRGDDGDTFPGTSGNRFFDFFSQPSSQKADGIPSQVSVLNISDSQPTMGADMYIIDEQPILCLEDILIIDTQGNGDRKADPGEEADCVITLRNYGREARNVTGILSTSDPDIYLLADTVQFIDIPFTSSGDNQENPFRFSVDLSSEVHYAYFTLVVWGEGDTDSSEICFRLVIGHPTVLLIDDDEDAGSSEWVFDVEEFYRTALDSSGEVHDYWNRKDDGSPASDLLTTYDVVIWFTGSAEPALSAGDIETLISFLDSGGKLFISGQDVGSSLQYSSFLTNYLHAGLAGDNSEEGFLTGIPNDPISGALPGLMILSGANAANNQPSPDVITPLSEATPLFRYAPSGRTAGLRYEGQYRLVYLAFGFEALSSLGPDSEPLRRTVMTNILQWLKGEPTGLDTDIVTATLPQKISLSQNSPNPFNASTDIRYQISESSLPTHTTLKIFNLLGQEIRTLRDELMEPGQYTATWDGRDENGYRVASGLYFYRFTCGDAVQTKQMILLR